MPRRAYVTKIVALAVVGALASTIAHAGEMTDATGRVVSVAAPVTRIVAAGPPAEVLLYVFAPEAMVGWIRGVSPVAAPYVTAEAKALPAVGAVTAKGDDPEIPEVLARKPQLILDFGDVDNRYKGLAVKVQGRTGVPYVLIDGALAKMPESFRALGKLTGRAARGEELARYAEDVLARAAKVAATHAKTPVRVYVARSADGGMPAESGTNTGDVYDAAGLQNVGAGSNGLPGEVKALDPDVIIALDARFRETAKGAAWADVRAVRDGKIVTPPRAPWGWTDMPPSVSRLLGLSWLTSTFYGVPTKPELEAETVKFFKLFYHVDLAPEQVKALLG